jgi:hypothetical protein
MTSKRCFYCNGKFYKHENDINWRTGNGKDFAHLECYNSACEKLKPPGTAYDHLMNGIKSVQFEPLVRTEVKEMEELEC